MAKGPEESFLKMCFRNPLAGVIPQIQPVIRAVPESVGGSRHLLMHEVDGDRLGASKPPSASWQPRGSLPRANVLTSFPGCVSLLALT